MKNINNLTDKKFWSNNWKYIRLPARFFYNDFSHLILDKLISSFIDGSKKSFLEVGGCPGRWADYFYTKHNMICDSMDYDENNIKITKENYNILGIKGDVFIGDITDSRFPIQKQYDVVLSDGLIEHFLDSDNVFENHVKFLKNRGLLVMGVPNIKKSWFYNFFSKHDKESYNGYRHVDKKELRRLAEANHLDVLFCDYVGVFNIGLINMNSYGKLFKLFLIFSHIFLTAFLRLLRISKETSVFSPYIYLIAKK